MGHRSVPFAPGRAFLSRPCGHGAQEHSVLPLRFFSSWPFDHQDSPKSVSVLPPPPPHKAAVGCVLAVEVGQL